MNRRSMLKGGLILGVGAVLPLGSTSTSFVSAQGAGEFPSLTLTIRDEVFEFPTEIKAGRYAISVVNESSAPYHSTLARVPDGLTKEEVEASFQTDEGPEWFFDIKGVGLPDYGRPGETRTGIIDLKPGVYGLFSVFTPQAPLTIVVTGEFGEPAEPDADAEVGMIEMAFQFSTTSFPTGPQRIKLVNNGAMLHDFQMVAVPEGTTADQMIRLWAMPEDGSATPEPDLEEVYNLLVAEYLPAAAISMLGGGETAWLDLDLPVGTYAVVCPLPFPAIPHVMEGMVEMVIIA